MSRTAVLLVSLCASVCLRVEAGPPSLRLPPLPPDADVVAGRMRKALLPTSSSARQAAVVKAQQLSAALLPSNCTWPDVHYGDKSRTEWSPSTHVARVFSMAVGATVAPSGAVAARLLANVTCALRAWVSLDPRSDNWWFNQIDVPQSLSDTCLLLTRSGVPTDLQPPLVAIMKRATWWKGWTGANLVWMVNVQIRRGLFTGNSTAVSGGFQRLFQEAVVVRFPADGIQADGSYSQHGDNGRTQLLAGSYGSVFTQDLLQAVTFSVNTTYAATAAQAAALAGFITRGQAWMTTPTRRWDFNVIGRGATRPGSPGSVGFSGLAQLAAEVPQPQRQQLLDYAGRLAGRRSAPALTGSTVYPCTDYTVHRGTDWFVSIKTFSNRTVPARCVNEEAKTSQLVSNGAVAVYSNSSTAPYDDMGGLWDYHRIPGIAAEQNTPFLACAWDLPVNFTHYVGGVEDGPAPAPDTGGLTAMNLSANSLFAQQSWHATARGFTAVSTLACPSTNPTYTTLASRRLHGAVHVMVAGADAPTVVGAGTHTFNGTVRWFHHDDIVYSPAAGAVLSLSVGTVTQPWSRVGASSGNVTADVFTAFIDHGAHASMAGGAVYSLLPSVPLAAASGAVAAYSASMRMVSATPDAHVTFDGATNTTRIAMWTAPRPNATLPTGQTLRVSASARCFMSLTVSQGVLVVSAASPEPAVTSLHVTVVGLAAVGPLCATAAGSTATTVQLQLNGGSLVGATSSAVCKVAV